MSTDLTDKAIRAAMENNWSLAVTLNHELLKNDPKDIDAMCRLARAQIELGKKTVATKIIKEILAISPYNPIASKLKQRMETGSQKSFDQQSLLIDEPGKTRTVSLTNCAPPKTISQVEFCQKLTLEPKKHTVCVLTEKGKYLGTLPDDVGRRLNLLMKAGNCYECICKSSSSKEVIVFIREVKRCSKYAQLISFPSKYNHQDHREFSRTDESSTVFSEEAASKKKVTVDDIEEDDVPLANTIHQDEVSEETT